MKKNIILLILLFSFKVGTSQNLKRNSILKRANPKFLNLKKAQIFIDTTRNSKFYLSIKNWKKSKYDKKDIKMLMSIEEEDIIVYVLSKNVDVDEFIKNNNLMRRV